MSQSLMFPSDLRAATMVKPYVKFSIPVDVNNAINTAVRSVILFMPDDIGVTDGTSYEGVDLGVNKALQSIKGGDVSNADIAVAGLAIGDMISTPLAKLNPTNAIAIANRVAFNPQTAQQYKGTDLREFNFTYTLAPSSAEESGTMLDIENFFRKFLYPAESGEWSISYPPLFRVDFMIGMARNTYYPMYYDSYLKGVTTAMNPNGRSFFSNGAPTSMNITLQFVESKQLTRNTLYGNGSGLSYNTSSSGMRPQYTEKASPLSVSKEQKNAYVAYAQGGETNTKGEAG